MLLIISLRVAQETAVAQDIDAHIDGQRINLPVPIAAKPVAAPPVSNINEKTQSSSTPYSPD